MQRLDDGYSPEEPGEVFGHTSIKTIPVCADYWSGRLADIGRKEKMVGARGFELCPLAPSCRIFNELQKQIGAVHTLFTVSSEKLN
jgi:hypothetical protein